METFEHLLYQLHLSYLQARKNKRNTHNQLAFELNQETIPPVEKVSIKPTDFNQFTARFTAMLGFLAKKWRMFNS